MKEKKSTVVNVDLPIGIKRKLDLIASSHLNSTRKEVRELIVSYVSGYNLINDLKNLGEEKNPKLMEVDIQAERKKLNEKEAGKQRQQKSAGKFHAHHEGKS